VSWGHTQRLSKTFLNKLGEKNLEHLLLLLYIIYMIYLIIGIITLIHVGNLNGKEIADVKIEYAGNTQAQHVSIDFTKAIFAAIAWPAYYTSRIAEAKHKAHRLGKAVGTFTETGPR
jgi:hypothetical protein